MTYDIPGIQQKVQDLYAENLKRAGEAEGVDYYTKLVTNGVTLAEVDRMMEASPEYAALNGGSGTGTGTGFLANNGRTLLLVGAVGLVVFIVIRRAKK